MFLQALYELSQREELVPDDGYVKEHCHYVIRLSPEGKLLSFTLKPQKLMIPQAKARSSGIEPKFFIENTKYVFGFGGKRRDLKAKEAKRLVRLSDCFNAYLAQVDEAAANTKDPGAIACSLFGARLRAWKLLKPTTANPSIGGLAYFDLEELLAMAPEKDKKDKLGVLEYPDGWTGSEVFVCHLEDEEKPIFQRPALRTEWARLRGVTDKGRLGRCLLTGKIAPVVPFHPPIKNLPGAQASGAFVCCYDKEAFSSRGAVQGENACISREGAEGYAAALNWLLERTETRQHQWGVRVGDETVMVVWTAVKSQFALDLVAAISPDPGKVLQYPASAWSGMAPDPIDESAFFAAVISPNASRVVVRDFIHQPVGEIKHNVLQYLDDLKIGPDPQPISMWLMQRALNLQLRTDAGKGGTYLPGILASSLMQAILRGTPYPFELLNLALTRLRDPSLNGRTLEICCAVIKAVLLRLPPGQRKEVTVALDETNTQMPYLLGRLFAVMEKLQKVALPEINTSMRDKHFSTAYQAPAHTYPELLALSSHHFSKTENVRQGRGRWLERLKENIIGAMPTTFPVRLLPVEQGQWMLGYYHQRQDFFVRREPVPVAALTTQSTV